MVGDKVAASVAYPNANMVTVESEISSGEDEVYNYISDIQSK